MLAVSDEVEEFGSILEISLILDLLRMGMMRDRLILTNQYLPVASRLSRWIIYQFKSNLPTLRAE